MVSFWEYNNINVITDFKKQKYLIFNLVTYSYEEMIFFCYGERNFLVFSSWVCFIRTLQTMYSYSIKKWTSWALLKNLSFLPFFSQQKKLRWKKTKNLLR